MPIYFNSSKSWDLFEQSKQIEYVWSPYRSEGKLGPKDPAIMDSFIEPIGGFIALLAIGVMCGGLGFVSTYRNNS